MNRPFLYLILALTVLASPFANAQNAAGGATSGAPAAPGTGSGDKSQRMEAVKEAFDQLGLTDAQKAQIKQIRASTQPGKERREQIMAVLTPDQKSKLMEMIQQYMAGQSQ